MRYLSLCSGIEAATVAWHPMGWEPAAFAEIESFPAAVLRHHYPNTPNLGDMTKWREWNVGAIDLLVGGTPCQSFSVAGLRKGLSDPRGGLMLTYLEIARRLRPRWVVWENVPGVLSSNGGRDFGSFLGALGELGYGWAYRVLDAQWVRTQRHPRAVPQRRRRVFVVGCLGNARAPAAILLEQQSVQRDSQKGRASREGAPADAADGAGAGQWWDGSDCDATLTKQNANGAQRMPDKDNLGAVLTPFRAGSIGGYTEGDAAGTIRAAGGDLGGGSENLAVYGALCHRITNTSVQEAAAGHLIAVPFRKSKRAQSTTDDESWVEAEQAVGFNWQNAGGYGDANEGLGITVEGTGPLQRCQSPAVAHALRGEGFDASEDGTGRGTPIIPVAPTMTVRRLTPRECERLQAFPDDYTLIPWRKKPADQCPDGPRYKALGNSMAVNCMEWIGRRIDAVEKGTELPA